MALQTIPRQLFFEKSEDGGDLAYVAFVTGEWVVTKNGNEIARGQSATANVGLEVFKGFASRDLPGKSLK